MTTRVELRTALRQRLEDTGAGALWDDATLNEAVGGAIRTYGARFPQEATVSVAVGTGATQVAVAAPVIDAARIVRVLDGTGVVVDRQAEGMSAAGGDASQAWRWWGGTLILARPAIAGTWQIEYLAARSGPVDDVSQASILPGDEEIVLVLAAATALHRRAIEDAKRGLRPEGVRALAEAARAEADRLMAARRRRASGGWLG